MPVETRERKAGLARQQKISRGGTGEAALRIFRIDGENLRADIARAFSRRPGGHQQEGVRFVTRDRMAMPKRRFDAAAKSARKRFDQVRKIESRIDLRGAEEAHRVRMEG